MYNYSGLERVKGNLLHSEVISSDLIDFFPVESNGEGPRSKLEWEDGRTDSEKMARVSVCDISGATSPSCKATQAIRNVHNQPESLCRRPAVVKLICPIEFKTTPHPRILDAWHQGRNTGHIFVSWDFFFAIFGRLFDRDPVQNLTLSLHHRTPWRKTTGSEIMILECSFPLNY